uniref:Variant surface glycoprotein 1125.3198 n=1 Tax=Trypanosoma brucei TaxID=5691 RepID=A0A1J0R9R9_9TRYP|nr:variant surface glycoprotein 1125.3198 [Trypanosoma brucei]
MQLITLGAVVVTVAFLGVEALSLHSDDKQITTACHVAREAAAVAGKMKSHYTQQESNLQTVELDLLKLELAAEIAKGPQRQSYAPLIAAASSLIARAKSKLKELSPAVLAVSNNLGALAAAEEMVQAFTELKFNGKAEWTAASALSGNKEGLAYKDETNSYKTCHDTTRAATQPLAGAKTTSNNRKITVFHAEIKGAGTTSGTDVMICHHSDSTGTNCGHVDGTATKMAISEGYLTKPNKQQYSTKNNQHPDYKPTQNTATGILPTQAWVAAKLAGLRKLKSDLSWLSIKADALQQYSITSDPACIAVITQIAAARLQKKPDKVSNDEIQKLTAEFHGDDQDKFNTKVWKVVDGMSIKKEAIGGEAGAKIGTTNDEAKLAAALAYYMTEPQPQKTTVEKKTTQSTEGECDEITDKTQCSAKNGCKYNEKDSKCENDSSKATTTEESTSKCSEKKNKMSVKMVANGREQNAKIPLFSSIKN